MYTAHHDDDVSRLVFINSMYRVRAPWPLAKGVEDPRHPGTFDPNAGPCRLADATGLLAGWNRSIPGEDKEAWRDLRVAEAFVRMGLSTDPDADTRNPPAVCIPGAFRLEHYLTALTNDPAHRSPSVWGRESLSPGPSGAWTVPLHARADSLSAVRQTVTRERDWTVERVSKILL